MGLLSEAIMVELGYSTREEAEARLVQSLTSLISDWPREPFSGFMVHSLTEIMTNLGKP